MTKRYFTVLVLLSALSLCAFAQDNSGNARDASSLDQADPSLIGIESAEQRLKEVSVDKFENEGSWVCSMSSDEGIIQGRLFEGAPKQKQPIPEEEGLNLPDNKVYGAKVSYYRRGYNSFEIYAVKPIPVEGITKTVSVWVVGRSYPHVLKLILEDYMGKRFELYVGKLNHAGWKLMTVAVPPQNAAGTGIVQKDYHYGTSMGLKVVGFRIECNPWEAYGNYYIYFDDLRAVTDLYEVDLRDEDDMKDTW
ncbi:MAG: flagellar filament outer layer protein FlaA [Treponema sp.]|uniref:flagellar filament outer layer protein FlaA n=1 Tax=Treponema sp. TaxID=166 RepID=UPI003FA21ED3